MPRYRLPPLTLAQLESDGPPVRLRDLVAMTGLSLRTIQRDIAYRQLHAFRRRQGASSPYFVDRDVARAYLARMGFTAAPREVAATVVSIARARSAR